MPDRKSMVVVALTVGLVAVPSVLAIAGVSVPVLKPALRPGLAYTLGNWTAALLALFSFVLAWGPNRSRRPTTLLAFGYGFLVIGLIHAVVVLAANGALWRVADTNALVPVIGFAGRTTYVLLLLLGVFCSSPASPRWPQGKLSLALSGSLALGGACVAVVFVTGTHPRLPQMVYPDSWVPRPFDLLLIPLVFAAALLLRRCRSREPGVFVESLLLSMLPLAVAHAHLAFGSAHVFDHHHRVAQFLLVVSNLVILHGLAKDYSGSFREEVARLETTNRTLVQRTREVDSANNALKSEIYQRRRVEEELRLAAERLEASNRELQHFAHIASHDLQEPLRKIQAFGDRLRQKCAGELEESGLDWLERMLGAARRMQTLISDLLAYSRVNQKPPAFQPVDLVEVVRGVLSDLELQLALTGGRVEVGALPVVLGEAWQMRQLMQNLIGNGLKFHREDEAPVVRVGGVLLVQRAPSDAAGETSWCVITVADNGIGVDAEYAEDVFLPFRRLHGHGQYAGSGMGLAIARRIVERHGGQIEVGAGPGGGSVFRARLPARSGKGDVQCAVSASSSAL